MSGLFLKGVKRDWKIGLTFGPKTLDVGCLVKSCLCWQQTGKKFTAAYVSRNPCMGLVQLYAQIKANSKLD